MSAGEKAFMEFCHATRRNYELHRVFDIDRKPRRVIYTMDDLLHFRFTPHDYLVTRGE